MATQSMDATTSRSERIMATVVIVLFAMIVGSSLVEVSNAGAGELADSERYRACEELPQSVSISCRSSAP